MGPDDGGSEIDSGPDSGPHTGMLAYTTHCLYCHGVNREGDPIGVYPALSNLDDEAYVTDVIEKGSSCRRSRT